MGNERKIYVDGQPITLVFGRLKKDAFYNLEARKQELRAAGHDLTKGGPEFTDLLIDTILGLVRKVWGQWPDPENSVDLTEFLIDEGIETIDRDLENQIKFIRTYYFQDIITFASEMLGPSRPMVEQIKTERDAVKNLSAGSVSTSTGSTIQPFEGTTSAAPASMESTTSTGAVSKTKSDEPTSVN